FVFVSVQGVLASPNNASHAPPPPRGECAGLFEIIGNARSQGESVSLRVTARGAPHCCQPHKPDDSHRTTAAPLNTAAGNVFRPAIHKRDGKFTARISRV